MEEEKVEVIISTKETSYYESRVEMSKSEFQDMKSLFEEEGLDGDISPLHDIVRKDDDWVDAYDFECTGFELDNIN